METRGIILAGGTGWEEDEFANSGPLFLRPVAHVPLLAHTLEWLAAGGITETTICANSSWKQTRHALAAEQHAMLTYFVDAAPRGAAGCIRDALEQFGGRRALVVEGTILPNCDLAAVMQTHIDHNAMLTVVASPAPFGSTGGLTERYVPGGLYVVEGDVIDCIEPNGFQDIKEMLIPRLHKDGHTVAIHELGDVLPRVTNMSSYLTLNAVQCRQLTTGTYCPPGYKRVGDSLIHETARVSSSDRLIGPVLLGPETVVARDVTIVGPTVVGRECLIQSEAVVCASVVWNECYLGEHSVVDHAVLGDRAVVAPRHRVDHTFYYSPDRKRDAG